MLADNETDLGLNSTGILEESVVPEYEEESFFKYLVEGILMPCVSLFGIIGNLLSMYILRQDILIRARFYITRSLFYRVSQS